MVTMDGHSSPTKVAYVDPTSGLSWLLVLIPALPRVSFWVLWFSALLKNQTFSFNPESKGSHIK